MAVWMSWNIDIPRSLNSRDSFPRRKVENRAQTSCSPSPILSPRNISFELHAKVAEEIDLEMCSYGQLSEVQMLRGLDLDLGSGQGHINMHSTCRTTSVPNCSVIHCGNMAVWISWNMDIRRSLNSRDSFPRGNSKIELRQGAVQVPYYHWQTSVLSSTRTWRRR